MTPDPNFGLSPQQVHFFETFGYLRLRRLFVPDEMARISRAFDDVFATHEHTVLDPHNEIHNARDERYAGDVRHMVFDFLDRSPDLAWLRSDPRVTGIVSGLLGDDTEELPADGNVMNCDVSYHSDVYGSGLANRNLKLFFYLEPLTGETGALRLIPGTNHHPSEFSKRVRSNTVTPEKIIDTFGVADEDLPSVSVDVEPGDVIVNDFRTIHASFRGKPGRRLFTLNYRIPVEAPEHAPA